MSFSCLWMFGIKAEHLISPAHLVGFRFKQRFFTWHIIFYEFIHAEVQGCCVATMIMAKQRALGFYEVVLIEQWMQM